MRYKVGPCIIGGGYYNPNTPPPSVNPSAIVGRFMNHHQSVDGLLEQHEGTIRVARGLKKGVQITPPNTLELCYLGIQVIKDPNPNAYSRYIAILKGYGNAGVIDQKTGDVIFKMLEKNRIESITDGIGAMTEPPNSNFNPKLNKRK